MYVSEAGDLYTSGLLMTNKIFFDFLIVTRLTPCTCFKPENIQCQITDRHTIITEQNESIRSGDYVI